MAAASPLRELLRAFSRQEVGVDAVMRALMEHQDFYVPQFIVDRERVHPVALVLSERSGAIGDHLYLFTDQAAAIRANDYLPDLGVYAGGHDALEWLASIETYGWPGGIWINPGPREERWRIGAADYPLARAWATGVAIERLAPEGDSPRLRALIAAHTFLIPVVDDRELLHTGPDGRRWMVACAAIDVSRRVLARFDGPVEAYPSHGAHLAAHLRKNGIAGAFLAGANVTLPLAWLESSP